MGHLIGVFPHKKIASDKIDSLVDDVLKLLEYTKAFPAERIVPHLNC